MQESGASMRLLLVLFFAGSALAWDTCETGDACVEDCFAMASTPEKAQAYQHVHSIVQVRFS